MKILHLHNAGSHPYHYCEMLRRKNVDARLYTLEYHLKSHPLWEIIDTDIKEIEEEESYRYYPRQWIDSHRDMIPEWVDLLPQDNVDGDPSDNFTSSIYNIKIIQDLRQKDVDLIHAWSLYGAVWAYLSGHKYIYHNTGCYDWNTVRRMDASVKKYLYGFVVNRAIDNAEIVVSEAREARKISKAYPDVTVKSPRHVIDTEYFSPLDIDEPPYVDDSEEYLFFTGTRQNWDVKHNDYIFKALADADLPSWRLMAVDWGCDIGRTKDLVSRLGLEDNVSFVPLMSRPRLRRMLNAVDVVFDGFIRGFGTCGTQALACGVPLISAFNFEDDMLEGGSGYGGMTEPPLLEAYSPEDIRLHLMDLVDDDYRNDVGEMSREWMMDYYSWEDGIMDHIEIYSMLVGV